MVCSIVFGQVVFFIFLSFAVSGLLSIVEFVSFIGENSRSKAAETTVKIYGIDCYKNDYLKKVLSLSLVPLCGFHV